MSLKSNLFKYTSIFVFTSIIFSCGNKQNEGDLTNSDAKPELENAEVNVNDQAKPNLIVIPSDELLQKFGMLKQEDAEGKTIYIRDFKSYLLKDPNAKFIIASIQSSFIDAGFPLNDLEQTLKSINDQEIVDDVDNIQKDAKSMLLTSVRPDVILELDYDLKSDFKSRNLNKTLSYTLRGIDAFSNKVVATIQQSDFGNDKSENEVGSLMKSALDQDIDNFKKQITGYFGDIIKKGREITVRVAIDKDIKLSMDDDCLDGNTYADWVIDYLKTNSQKGAYKLERNTDSELFFRNVRIKTLNDDGTQYSAYDFAKDMKKAIDKGCGMKSKNKTQGLGDAYIVLKGM